MEIRDLFDGLDASESIALAEEIGHRLASTDTAILILDEMALVIGERLDEESLALAIRGRS
jgi:hypothetical protein